MIGICTDSNSQLPASLAQRYGIEVVPLTVTVDGAEYMEGIDLDADAFYAKYTDGHRPAVSTSQPSPGQFAVAYDDLLARGCTEILSIHVSGAMSGTLNAARLAAHSLPTPVRLVDSGTASFGISCCVWAAAAAIADGATLDQAAQIAEQLAPSIGNVFVVGALDHLHAGGRGTGLAHGDDLAMLTLRDGNVEVVERAHHEHVADAGRQLLGDLGCLIERGAVGDGGRRGPHAAADAEAGRARVDQAHRRRQRVRRQPGGVQRARHRPRDVDGQDLGAPTSEQVVVGHGELPGAGLAGGHRRPVAIGVLRIEGIGVEVDAFHVLGAVDGDGERHHLDAVPLRQRRRQLRVRVGADADHAAARNRETMTELLTAAASGRPEPGVGPHRLGHPLRHQTSPPSTHIAQEARVAVSARCFTRGLAIASAATPTSMGK